MMNFGVREKKAALLKVSILDEMLRLLATKGLSDITVEELCSNINTTKVTFFKNFTYKEQVFDYFVHKWLYDRSFDIHRKRYCGEEGIYKVFESICEDHVNGKNIMVSLTHYYSKLTEKPSTIEPLPYEYYLFNSEAFDQQVIPLNLEQVFVHYLNEMESIHSSQYHTIVCQLLALMYGVPIQTHIMGIDDMYPYYEKGVRNILGHGTCTEVESSKRDE
jgi:AcrR family transcriptional regulator